MKRPIRTLGILLAVSCVPAFVLAADHGDSPAATSEPAADITDLYAWMSADASQLNLVMNVYADAGADARFSDAVVYVFSVTSSPGYGQPQVSTRMACKFVADGVNVECWLGNEYAAGDPTDPEGLLSDNGGMRVFAGRRDDPFFLNYDGFLATVNAAVEAVESGAVSELDEESCPLLTPEQSSGLAGMLSSGVDGARASNTFAGQSVLALVVQVDKSLVNSGGPVFGVSASTHALVRDNETGESF